MQCIVCFWSKNVNGSLDNSKIDVYYREDNMLKRIMVENFSRSHTKPKLTLKIIIKWNKKGHKQ